MVDMTSILKLVADATRYVTLAQTTLQELETLYASVRDGLSSNDAAHVQAKIDELHGTIQGNTATLDALRDAPEPVADKPAASKAK